MRCAVNAGRRRRSRHLGPFHHARATDQGAFQVRYTSELEPLAINELHSWTIHVERPDGQPVTGATVTIDGGMPAHNHGLPTTPQVTEVGGGDYRVDGVKFQMPGQWTMTVDVDAGGVRVPSPSTWFCRSWRR